MPTKLALFFSVQLEDYMLPCLTKKYFGVDCLGCGIQRSFALILNGDFVAAFKMYPAIYTLILFFILVGVNIFYKFKHSAKLIGILAASNIAIIIISFIYKHLN